MYKLIRSFFFAGLVAALSNTVARWHFRLPDQFLHPMIKYLLIGLLALVSPVIAGDYTGHDDDGNYYHGHIDENGDYTGHDDDGNYYHGHVDENGDFQSHDG